MKSLQHKVELKFFVTAQMVQTGIHPHGSTPPRRSRSNKWTLAEPTPCWGWQSNSWQCPSITVFALYDLSAKQHVMLGTHTCFGLFWKILPSINQQWIMYRLSSRHKYMNLKTVYEHPFTFFSHPRSLRPLNLSKSGMRSLSSTPAINHMASEPAAFGLGGKNQG